MGTPPTRVGFSTPAVGYLSAASPKTTPTFDVVNGDLLILIAQYENGTASNNTPTWDGTGTWSTVIASSPRGSNESAVTIFQCPVTATATGRTVSLTESVGSLFFGFSVTIWRDHGGVGASAQTTLTVPTTGAPSRTLTTTLDNSAIQVGNDDWNAVDGASRTWRSVNGSPMTETLYARNTTNYAAYGAYSPDAGAIGTITVGLTAPTGQTYSIATVEIKGTAGAAAAAPTVPLQVWPALTEILGGPWPRSQEAGSDAAVVVAADDPELPLPVIVAAQQIPQLLISPFIFTAELPPGSVVPLESTVISPQGLPLSLPYVFVSEPLRDPPAAPTGTPARPLVVKSLEAPTSLPEVFTAAVCAVAATPADSVTVRAIELPWIPPQIFIAKTQPAELLDVTPPVPTIAIGAGIFGGGSAFVNRAPQPPVVTPPAPPKPTVVSGQLPPPATWWLAGTTQAVGAQSTPAATTPTPTVVASQQHPQAQPFARVAQPKVFAAAPVAGETPPRPTVIPTSPPPPATWRLAGTAQAVGAQSGPAVAGPVIKPTVVGSLQPPPVSDFAGVAWTTVNETKSLRSTVVNGIPAPLTLPVVYVAQTKTAPPPPPPVTPIKPMVVNAQPLPTQYVQAPWVSYTEVDPPKVPVYPTVVGQQPIPPQAPFTATPKAGRWGTPPPNHRIITPSVTTDMSLPFRPNGWVRVAHGFAEALPLLYEGTVAGGTLEGALVSGGVMTGSAIGGTIQNGYITGGVR